MAANVSAVQMTYIMISLNFFTTRASQPYTHTHTEHFQTNQTITSYSSLQITGVLYKKNPTNLEIVLLLDRDLQDEWGTLCSFQRYFCNSWWVRCCFWILRTSVYTASLSNCGCHNTEAVKMKTMETQDYCSPSRKVKQQEHLYIWFTGDSIPTCLWT